MAKKQEFTPEELEQQARRSAGKETEETAESGKRDGAGCQTFWEKVCQKEGGRGTEAPPADG